MNLGSRRPAFEGKIAFKHTFGHSAAHRRSTPGLGLFPLPLQLALIISCFAATTRAQTEGSFNPGADSPVYAMALQADGKILVGGTFRELGGVNRNCLGRLNSDGSVDPAFTQSASLTVTSFAVQPDGKVLVGGAFAKIGGVLHIGIARLDTNGLVDAGFEASVKGYVSAFALQANGQILVAGYLLLVGTTNHLDFCRINPDGSMDTNFNPNVVGTVNAIVVQTNGQIVIGGSFGTVGGKTCPQLARLNSDGTLDTNYPSVTVGSIVKSLALQPNGQVLVGGAFSMVGDKPCSNLVRVNSDGTMDVSFTPDVSAVDVLAIQTDGRILVGALRIYTFVVGRRFLGRLNADGTLDDTFNPTANNDVYCLAVQSDGRILVGGNFTAIGGQPRYRIGRLETDGTATYTFSGNPNDEVYAIAIQPNGKLLVGGYFSLLAGQTRPYLGRFNAERTLDTSFAPVVEGANNLIENVNCLAVQTNGDILVAGSFKSLAGGSRDGFGRIHADGSLDSSFDIALGDDFPHAYCITVQTNGQILVGATFSSVGGQRYTGLARLNFDGTRDPSFNPIFSMDGYGGYGGVYALALQPDGKILVGGMFSTVNGQSRPNIVRFHPNGTIDNTFSETNNFGDRGVVYCLIVQPDGQIIAGGPSEFARKRQVVGRLNPDGLLDPKYAVTADSGITTMALQTDGKLIVGGTFQKLNDVSVSCLARLNIDGSVDTSFNARLPVYSSFNYGRVRSTALREDGAVIVGGHFTTLAGKPCINLGWLNNTEAATQTLSTDGTIISWLRGGTSPEVWRTTFETSPDGIHWTGLGTGTRIDGGWHLTGLAVSTNDFFRARGFLTSGNNNGSSSFVESIVAPLAILMDDGKMGFSANRFGFNVQGTTGRNVVLEATTNLVDWTALGTNLLGASPRYITDPYSTNFPQRYYRLRYQ